MLRGFVLQLVAAFDPETTQLFNRGSPSDADRYRNREINLTHNQFGTKEARVCECVC